MVAGEDAVAGDHVVDLGRVEPDARRQRPEALGEQLLRMDVVQRAVGTPLAAGRADHVDDPGVGHRLVLAHLVVDTTSFAAWDQVRGGRQPELADERADLLGRLDRLGRRAAVPALRHREHEAGGLDDLAGDVGGVRSTPTT